MNYYDAIRAAADGVGQVEAIADFYATPEGEVRALYLAELANEFRADLRRISVWALRVR